MKLRALIDSSILCDITSTSAQEIAQAVHYFRFHYDIHWSILHDGSFLLPNFWFPAAPLAIPYPEISIVNKIDANENTIVLSNKEHSATFTVILNKMELYQLHENLLVLNIHLILVYHHQHVDKK